MAQGHLATRSRIHSVLTNIPPDPSTEAWDLALSRAIYNSSYYPPPPPTLSNHNSELNSSFLSHLVLLRSVRQLLLTASAVPSSPILVTLMKEALSSSEMSVLTRATWRNISTVKTSSLTRCVKCTEICVMQLECQPFGIYAVPITTEHFPYFSPSL
jgi:hypothetical protein